MGSALRHGAGTWIVPQWLILVVLLSKKVQLSFVSHGLSLGAVRPVLQMPRLHTAGGGDHHLHWYHTNHDWFFSCLPIPSFGPFYHQTSHMLDLAKARSAFLGCTQLSHTPATTITTLSAVPGSSRHLPICPVLRHLSTYPLP